MTDLLNRYLTVPKLFALKQIIPKISTNHVQFAMLFQTLGRTLKFPQPSPIVRQQYVDFLAGNFRLSHNGHHGLEHWMRVLINGRLLANENGADIEVVEHFALVHDVMRENENLDLHHGPRAADFVKSIVGTWIKLDDQQLRKLIEACRYHSVGRLDRDITIQTCWDADRLDLGRVGKKPKSTYLGSSLARDQSFMKMAYERSKSRFVIEGFNDASK